MRSLFLFLFFCCSLAQASAASDSKCEIFDTFLSDSTPRVTIVSLIKPDGVRQSKAFLNIAIAADYFNELVSKGTCQSTYSKSRDTCYFIDTWTFALKHGEPGREKIEVIKHQSNSKLETRMIIRKFEAVGICHYVDTYDDRD